MCGACPVLCGRKPKLANARSGQRETLRVAYLGQNRILGKRSRWPEWVASVAHSLWADY